MYSIFNEPSAAPERSHLGAMVSQAAYPAVYPEAELEAASAREIISWALERWDSRLALVTSFQREGMVLLDMAWRLDPGVRVVTLDTGRLPQETYDLVEKVRRRYGIYVEVHFPDSREVERMVRRAGPNLFYDSHEKRLLCCRVRKVEPLARALRDFDAWITGLRREQSPSRAGVAKVSRDPDHGGIVKLSPLADWSHEQVEAYVREHDVPQNALYQKGFTSIGCAPCTRPIQIGEDQRAGRWWWEAGAHKECGLHLPRATVAEASAEALALEEKPNSSEPVLAGIEGG